MKKQLPVLLSVIGLLVFSVGLSFIASFKAIQTALNALINFSINQVGVNNHG